MRFLELKVNNIGVFKGRHSFDLSNGFQKPMTIIGGHNGAGKTTLFRALPLVLHGSMSLGDRITQRAYSAFLNDLLHRKTTEQTPYKEHASVEAKIEYVKSSEIRTVSLKREWQVNSSTIKETLSLKKDKETLIEEEAQTWINDFIPISLIPISFFDAEELSTLTTSEKRNDLLKETLHRLLGLHLINRLKIDLKQFVLKQGGGQDIEKIKKNMLKEQSLLEKLDKSLTKLKEKESNLNLQLKTFEQSLEKEEGKLLSEGGAYAQKRPKLQKKLKQKTEEVDNISNELKQLCAELLPFTLAPKLNSALSEQLTLDLENQREHLVAEQWSTKTSAIIEELKQSEFWEDVGSIPKKTIRTLTIKIEALLKKDGVDEDILILHDLASSEYQHLSNWINTSQALPKEISKLEKQLRKARADQGYLEQQLASAPEDSSLSAIYKEISKIQKEISKLKKKQIDLSKKLGSAEKERSDQHRVFDRARKTFEAALKANKGTEFAQKSQQVLRSYQDALLRERLSQLEQHLINAFNTICRKEHLLKTAIIDPESFDIELRGTNNHPINLDDFSAGEKQLFVLALLNALRQLTQRELPLFIDTPFARLDENHRQRLLEGYFPSTSQQIILFTTDVELQVLIQPKPNTEISRLYHLTNDPKQGHTLVKCQDFNQEELSHVA